MKIRMYEDQKQNQWLRIGFRNPDICVFRRRGGNILAEVTHEEMKKDWNYVGKIDSDNE